HGNQACVGSGDARANIVELPFGDKLIAIQHDTPVACTSSTRVVLEAQKPVKGGRFPPIRSEDLDLRMDVCDGIERPVCRHAFIDNDLVCQWEMMSQHVYDVEVIVQAISNKCVNRDLHYGVPTLSGAWVGAMIDTPGCVRRIGEF